MVPAGAFPCMDIDLTRLYRFVQGVFIMMKVHACACEWCCRCYSLYSSYSVVFLFLPLLLFLFLFLLPLLLLLVLVQCELHEK